MGDTQYDLQAAHAAGIKFGLVAWGAKNQRGVSEADYVLAFPEEILSLTTLTPKQICLGYDPVKPQLKTVPSHDWKHYGVI
ncbi:HAD family hydrolase [Secundilactobacillus collinoides]|uniref:HAD family hydrolase n=1 Tax=Secundilactobacillus collinoides TaxID=33960 RepID=UPI0015857CE4